MKKLTVRDHAVHMWTATMVVNGLMTIFILPRKICWKMDRICKREGYFRAIIELNNRGNPNIASVGKYV